MRYALVLGFLFAGCSHHVDSHTAGPEPIVESPWAQHLGRPPYDENAVDAGTPAAAPNPDPAPVDMAIAPDLSEPLDMTAPADLAAPSDLSDPCEISSASGHPVPGLNCQ